MSLLRTIRPSRFQTRPVADDSEAAGTAAVVAVEALEAGVITITTAAVLATTAPLRPRSLVGSLVAHRVLMALHPPSLPSYRDSLDLVRMALVLMDTLTTPLPHLLLTDRMAPTAVMGQEQAHHSTSAPGLPH